MIVIHEQIEQFSARETKNNEKEKYDKIQLRPINDVEEKRNFIFMGGKNKSQEFFFF
jgi:hypothetical protein